MDLTRFHLICQMLVKFSGVNPKGMRLYLEKGKENLCVGFTYSIKRECEIRKFHIAAVQRQLRNVGIIYIRPGSDVALFMSQTQYIELGT